MADGTQTGFNFRATALSTALRPGEITVDLFAGGGGASTAMEHALGRPVDIAINHNPWAVSLHAANHPFTRHLCQDVWEADPRVECADRPVGHMHASPDCTHFSQAKGGQPRSRATRSLSWVVLRWAGTVRPRVITMENVRQILSWGPLVAKRCAVTGRVITLDMVPLLDATTGLPVKRKGKVIMVNRVAAPGERVPVGNQYLVPDKRHAGRTWRHFVAALQALGYVLEWRTLRACDYSTSTLKAGTSRDRLFVVARRDDDPIQWPKPTHGPGLQPYVSAADSIDFGDTGRSIFDRPKPLADATMRRIARGIKRYVLDAAEPFIVGVGGRMGQTMERPVSAPMQTITAKADACVCTPVLVQCANASANGVASAAAPLSTITATGSQQRLVTAHLVTNTTGHLGVAADQPIPTITRAGNQAVVQCTLSTEQEAGALRVAAFLMRYHGTGGQHADLSEPMTTITTRDRLALVTVTVHGVPYVIVDIHLRMLRPDELFRAQGFPSDYIIDRTADGRPVSISRAVAMVGNSVSPAPLAAILEANHATARTEAVAA